jgi:hypothetical protein
MTPMDEEQQYQAGQYNDRLLASAIQFLIDGGDEKAAALLLSCTLSYQEEVEVLVKTRYLTRKVILAAPRLSYDVLEYIDSQYHCEEYPDIPADLVEKVALSGTVRRAFHALISEDVKLVVKATLVPITAQWREELLGLLRGDHVTNQGLLFAPERPVVPWNGLRFRSRAEVCIAEALERARVLFLPNCMARLGVSRRQSREADFLICHQGKWGILEVDGPLAHPPSRTVEDHERDRLFKAHGIRLVEHFDADKCMKDADGVVKRFLYLLGQ